MAMVPAKDVREVPDVQKSASGKTMYEYVGKAYMPEGAKRLYALTLDDARRKFGDSAEDFSYQNDYEAPDGDEDSDSTVSRCGDPGCRCDGWCGR